MLAIELPVSPLPGLHMVELTSDRAPALQRFFEANPEYFLAVNGEPPGPKEALEEIQGELPPGWSFTKKWLIGYIDEMGYIVAMVNVVSDLLSPGVWHIGLILLATSRHGTGEAQILYHGLENWAFSNGARWLRLGVVLGNVRAEQFWERLGYIQTRTRDAVEMGRLKNTVRVLVKPLAGGILNDYLTLLPRDRPEIP